MPVGDLKREYEYVLEVAGLPRVRKWSGKNLHGQGNDTADLIPLKAGSNIWGHCNLDISLHTAAGPAVRAAVKT